MASVLSGLGLILLGVAAAALAMRAGSCRKSELAANRNQVRGAPYPLDNLDRSSVPDGAGGCPEVELVDYGGTTLR
jgi:hypothetical protein